MLWSRLIGIVVALGLFAMPALAQGTTLTGTVTYNERMALPRGAFLQVSLVRLPGGQAVTGAAAAIPAKGQLPIAWTLNLHDGVATDGGSYGILADIAVSGRVLFRTARPVPVEVGAASPTAVLVRFSPDPEPHAAEVDTEAAAPDGLIDQLWTVTSIGGRPVSGARPLTLSIAADHRAGGSAGCNNFFTEATIDDTKLYFGPAAATRMACATAITDQETAYMAALAAVGGYELDGTSLRLLDAAGIPLIGLIRAAE